MNISKKLIMLLLSVLILLPSCGKEDEDLPMSISGKVSVSNNILNPLVLDSPVYVIVSKTMDINMLAEDPQEAIIAYVLAAEGSSAWKFDIDLTGTGVESGDDIYIIGYIETDQNRKKLPVPSPGDYIGIYINNKSSIDGIPYELEEGENEDADFTINKVYVEIDASVEGTIEGDGNGNVLLVAYADSELGSDNIGDLDNINFDKVIAFSVIQKKKYTCEYKLDVLPFFPIGELVGNVLPVSDVMVFAVLDKNENSSLDAGENVGFYRGNKVDIDKIEIDFGTITGIDISIDRQYYPNDVTVSGKVTGDPGGDVTVFVFAGSDSTSLFPSTFDPSYIIGFTVVTKTAFVDKDYTINVLPFAEFPRDNVSIYAIIDDGNQDADENEPIGFYIDDVNKTSLIHVPVEGLTNIDIAIDKNYHKHNSYISGVIEGSAKGDNITVLAYIGDAGDLGVSAFDHNNVVALVTVSKPTAASVDYTMKVLPHKEIPITSIAVFALQDKNKNASPDDGEAVGFYLEPGTMNETFDINGTDETVSGINVTLDKTYHEHRIFIEGELQGGIVAPGDNVTMVAYQGNLDNEPLEGFDINKVVGYTKVTLGAGPTHTYSMQIINLFEPPLTGVSVFALRDTDLDKLPTDGELVGYYRSGGTNSGPAWSNCSAEGGTCTVSGTKEVRYGAGSAWFSSVFTSNVACNNTTFGDPIPGSSKTCEIRDSVEPVNDLSVEVTIPVPTPTTDDTLTLEGYHIVFDKTFYEHGVYADPDVHGAYIRGNIAGGEIGDEITLVAYSGDLASVDLGNINFDNVIAFSSVTIDDTSQTYYSLKMLPIFAANLTDVSLLAVRDLNGNRTPDDGEIVGYYLDEATNSLTFSLSPDIDPGTDVVPGADGIDVTMDRVYTTNKIRIRGEVTLSGGASAYAGEDLYIIAMKGSLDSLDMENMDYENIVTFTNVGSQSYPYDYDVTVLPFNFGFSSVPSQVNLFAVLDANGDGLLNAGDRGGIYIDQSGSGDDSVFTTTVSLVDNEPLPVVDIVTDKNIIIDKVMNSYGTKVQFKLDTNPNLYSYISIKNKNVMFALINWDVAKLGFLSFSCPTNCLVGIKDGTNLRDHIVGFMQTVLPDSATTSLTYSVPVAPLIDESLTGSSIDVFLLMIVDEDNSGFFNDGDDPRMWYNNEGSDGKVKLIDINTNLSVQSLSGPDYIDY